jgi:hypothetical protein
VSFASFPPELRLFTGNGRRQELFDQIFTPCMGGPTFALILLAAPVAATAMRIPVAS